MGFGQTTGVNQRHQLHNQFGRTSLWVCSSSLQASPWMVINEPLLEGIELEFASYISSDGFGEDVAFSGCQN